VLEAAGKLVEPMAPATRRERRCLTGEDRLGERMGKVIGRYKMAKHLAWSLDSEGRFPYRRNAAEAVECPRCRGARWIGMYSMIILQE